MKDLKAEYRLQDSGDNWGDCMNALFDIAEVQYHRGTGPPDEWKYSPGLGVLAIEDRDDEEWTPFREACYTASEDSLEDFGALLWRYRSLLEAADMADEVCPW